MRKIFKVMTIVIVSVFCFASCNNCKDNTPTAKYIFYFIGDGMGNTHVALTESYLSYKAGKENGERLSFTQFPYLALAETWPIGGHITCSSASGTALACGIKTTNNSLGVDPDGNEGTSIAVELHNQGYNVGIMSSVPVNHATPASFFAHNKYRGKYYVSSCCDGIYVSDTPTGEYKFLGKFHLKDGEWKEGYPDPDLFADVDKG
jgi:alkaline phosphatase